MVISPLTSIHSPISLWVINNSREDAPGSAARPTPGWCPLQLLIPTSNSVANGTEDSNHSFFISSSSRWKTSTTTSRLSKCHHLEFSHHKHLVLYSFTLAWTEVCYWNAVLPNTEKTSATLNTLPYFIKRLRPSHELSLRGLWSASPFWCSLALLCSTLTKICFL